MAERPEGLNRYYFDLFSKTLKENAPGYNRSQKRFITPLGTVESVASPNLADEPVGPARVGELSDYAHFRHHLSVEEVDPKVETVVYRFAQQLAETIEELIQETSQFGTPICYDLFKLSDGSPNLRTNYAAKGNEPTKDDPTGSITGWFGYNVRFTVSAIRSDRVAESI